ncbi:MAG TPA: hypothetical protein VM733_08480 [Thermoanaerobaculia bacterium]|nr:hypothetical protein [Thermoanaerobaculia bacterium]
MENREKDRVSQRITPTDAGESNRSGEEEKGRGQHSGTTAEFGQNIGESEFQNDEGGNMNNRDSNDAGNANSEREQTRRPSEGYGSSSGRSSGSPSSNEIGSSGSSSGSSSSNSSSSNKRGSSGELGSTGSSDRSEGRH